jgi:hypothetical protein
MRGTTVQAAGAALAYNGHSTRATGRAEAHHERRGIARMRHLLVVLWIFWAQMFFVFGVPSTYFIRTGDYARLAVSAPLFLLTLFLGWRLYVRTRRDWNRPADDPIA